MTKIKPSSSSLSAVSNLHSKSTTKTPTIYPFFTKPSKKPITQSSKYSKSIQYKANPELAELSHLIYKGEKIERFYTYERPSMVVVNLPDDEFSKPTLQTIDWTSFDSGNFDKDSVLPWLN